jgi:hypothetical protein
MMRVIAGRGWYQRLRLVINKYHEDNQAVETILSRLWNKHTNSPPLRNRDAETPPKDIVQGLLNAGNLIELALQRELVHEGKILRKTAAGSTVSTQLDRRLAKIKEDIKILSRDRTPDVPGQLTKLERIDQLKARKDDVESEKRLWKQSKERWKKGAWW